MQNLIYRFNHEGCPCCGTTNHLPFFVNPKPLTIQNSEDFFYGGHEYIHAAIQCTRCKFIAIDSNLTGNEIDQLYRVADNEYYLETSPQRAIYYRRVQKQLRKTRRLDILNNTHHPIIDLAAGSGEWLELWQKDKYATELSGTLVKILTQKGIQVIPQEISEISEQLFSMVSMFDFLEHVDNPKETLDMACRRLIPGGVLVIGVPDFGNLVARILRHKYYLFTPMHLGYYRNISLEYLLGQNPSIESFVLLKSPPFPISLQSLFKWVKTLKLPMLKNLEKVILPIGYSASIIAVANLKR